MGDPAAWLGHWPALQPGQTFAYPPSAYGVLTWWDYGDWVNAIGHRIPITNGTQANADKVAAFLTTTSPETAQRMLAALSARYAVLNSEVSVDFFSIIAQVARHYPGQFERAVYQKGPAGEPIPIKIFLPDYYRTMAVRLQNFDAEAIVAAKELSVFTTKPLRMTAGRDYEVIVAEKKFPSEEAAREYIKQHPGETMIFGSLDPLVSCVNVEPLAMAKLVFSTTPLTMPQTVKVFALNP